MATVKYNPIGYQVVDSNNPHIHPDMDASFCIYSKPQALAMIKSSENEVDTEWMLLPIAEGDIEDPTYMFEGDPETATEVKPSVPFMDRLTRAVKENNNKIDRDHDHAPEELNDMDSITVFKNKLAAFAKAAEELDNAWDYVDGDEQVMNALRALDTESVAWPFEKQLYYLALKDAQVWATMFASKLK
jgi:hypothetical protein